MVHRFGLGWLMATVLMAQPVARRSPEWLRDGVIYEVNTRTFSAAGNFRGVTEQLPRLKDLGVNILWLMPIHPVGRERSKGTLGSPYAVRDYFAINPDYGSADDLRRLVTEAHRSGFKVIIDIVANHTSWDSVMMKTPAFYKHDAAGKIISPVPDWADVAGLDYSNPESARLHDAHAGLLDSRIRSGRFSLRRSGDGSYGFLGASSRGA